MPSDKNGGADEDGRRAKDGGAERDGRPAGQGKKGHSSASRGRLDRTCRLDRCREEGSHLRLRRHDADVESPNPSLLRASGAYVEVALRLTGFEQHEPVGGLQKK